MHVASSIIEEIYPNEETMGNADNEGEDQVSQSVSGTYEEMYRNLRNMGQGEVVLPVNTDKGVPIFKHVRDQSIMQGLSGIKQRRPFSPPLKQMTEKSEKIETKPDFDDGFSFQDQDERPPIQQI